MMYNRYIPDAAGVYHPTRVGAEPQAAAPAPPPEPVCVPPAPPPPPPPAPPCTAEHGGFLSRLLPRSIDTGDLLMLLILLLLGVGGEEGCGVVVVQATYGTVAVIFPLSYTPEGKLGGLFFK